MTMYAIFSFDEERGPIKSWDRMKSVEVHNARRQPIDHAVPDAPQPEALVGSFSIVADSRARLQAHGIDPEAIRENGVIGYESVITASPEFFATGTPAEQVDRLNRWKWAQVEFVEKRYGAHCVVSMVLHQDEETPHIHAIILPLKLAPDRRRRDPAPRWGLDGQTIASRGMWRQLQTDYAKAMAPFGLSRGEEDSLRKHEPYRETMARVEADRQALALRTRAAEIREQDAAELLRKLESRRAEIETEAATLAASRQEQAVRNKEWAARNEAERLRLKGASEQIGELWGMLGREQDEHDRAAQSLAAESEQLHQDRADLAEERLGQAAIVDQAVKAIEEVEAIKAHLVRTMEKARVFAAAYRSLKGQPLPAEFVSAFRAAQDLKEAGEAAKPAVTGKGAMARTTFAAVNAAAQAIRI